MSEVNTRDELIQLVKDTWPEVGSAYYPARDGYVTIPSVREFGLTARLIEHAVDTVLAELARP